MTENGVANVWLRDTQASEDGKCTCGCDDPNCGCQNKHCNGNCCSDKGCGENHHFILLDRTKAGCITLGYDRYLCTECGKIEKRDYVDSLGHAWQSIVIRDATCETDGKLLELCSRCGQMKQTATPKGEHQYKTHPVAATCTNPGYTVRECSVCGDRHIEDITSVLPHNYESHVIAATCEGGGKTNHRCDGCGSSFVTDYTAPLGHSWDEGTLITNATCTGEGVMEYRCVRCGYHRIEGNEAAGHIPGNPATCTEPQLCTRCGAVLKNALGHDYKSEVTAPTCTEMGYTTNTCTRCGDSNKSDYFAAFAAFEGFTGHDAVDVQLIRAVGRLHPVFGGVMVAVLLGRKSAGDQAEAQCQRQEHGQRTAGKRMILVQVHISSLDFFDGMLSHVLRCLVIAPSPECFFFAGIRSSPFHCEALLPLRHSLWPSICP